MSDCSSNSCVHTSLHKKHRCPLNGREYNEVSIKTVMHHIKNPWNWEGNSLNYYFCDDPECDVVYFGQDDTVITRTAVRTKVGIKEQSGDALVCYCFGVTANEAATNPQVKSFVIEKTKGQICECETHNPSGMCCLKDFPKT